MSVALNKISNQIFGTSDACETGAGFCKREKWSYYKFTMTHRKNWHIDQKEAHAIIMMLHNLRKFQTGKRLVLYIDNAVLYWAMVRHWAGERMMPCIYEICLTMMEYRIDVWFEWIPTECNTLADSLSRFNLKKFWEWVKIHRISVEKSPIQLEYVHNLQMMTV